MRTTWKRSPDNPPEGQTQHPQMQHRLTRTIAASLLTVGMLVGLGPGFRSS